MLRTIVAVITAPITWGVVMFPGNLLLLAMFPGADTQPSTGYLIGALIGSVLYSLVAGAVAALVAGRDTRRIGIWAGLAVLAVGHSCRRSTGI